MDLNSVANSSNIIIPSRTISSPSVISEFYPSVNVQVRQSLSEPSLPSHRPTSSDSSTVDIPFGKRISVPTLSTDFNESHHLPRALSYPIFTHESTYRTVYFGHGNILDDEYLKAKYPLMDRKDICCIRSIGSNITFINGLDLEKYENITYIDAGENRCQFESFRIFRNLIELHLPLNDISDISIPPGQFRKLKILDLQCNRLTTKAVHNVGYLPSLRALNISSNGLSEFPRILNPTSFINLENLILDDNKLSKPMLFVMLSRIQKLKTLSLERNQITTIPYIDTLATNGSVKKFIGEWGLLKKSMLKTFEIKTYKPLIKPGEKFMQRVSSSELSIKSKKNVGAKKEEKNSCTNSLAYQNLALFASTITYAIDQDNHKFPFLKLEQISLAGNEIKTISDVQAIKTWKNIGKIVLDGNPVSLLPSRKLAPIKCYMVPQITVWPYSCRNLDPVLDPFHMKSLISKFLQIEVDAVKQCPCHKLEPENNVETHIFPNLDLFTSHPIPSKNFPFPSIRFCQFQNYIRSYFSKTVPKKHYHKTDYIPHSFPHCYGHENRDTVTSSDKSQA